MLDAGAVVEGLTAADLVPAVEEAATRVGYRELTSQADRAAQFPWEIWNSLCALGMPGLDLAVTDGGHGLCVLDTSIVMERLARHSIAATTAVFTFAGFGGHVVEALPSDHPLRTLLPGIIEGEVRASLGLTEPSGGSDLSGMRTRLRQNGGDWILSGAKLYTTLLGESTHIVVGALCPDNPTGGWMERFALAVVARETEGIRYTRVRTEALRTCPTYEVAFDEVRVPGDAIVEPPLAATILRAVLNKERIAVAAQSCGLGRRALTIAIEYAAGRELQGAPLLEKQAIRHALVERWESLAAARALTEKAARAMDCGDRSGILPTMAARAAARAAHEAADTAVQVHGGFGLTSEAEAQRLWRDTRLHLIGPIAREMSGDYLGRALSRVPDTDW